MNEQLKPGEYLRLAREYEQQQSYARSIAVLSTFTTELLRPYLIVESHRLGVPLRPWFAPINQIELLVLD